MIIYCDGSVFDRWHAAWANVVINRGNTINRSGKVITDSSAVTEKMAVGMAMNYVLCTPEFKEYMHRKDRLEHTTAIATIFTDCLGVINAIHGKNHVSSFDDELKDIYALSQGGIYISHVNRREVGLAHVLARKTARDGR